MLLVLFRRRVPVLGSVSILGPSLSVKFETPPRASGQDFTAWPRPFTMASGLHIDRKS